MIVSPQKSNSTNSTLESPTPVAARPHRKPQADLYTVFLVFTLVAVLVAILFLYLYMKSYKFETGGASSAAIFSHQSSLLASSLFSGS
jgi:hypothetical protein